MSATTEAWLEGPIDGVDAYLMPVAQSLVQVSRDLGPLAELPVDRLWARPGGVAAVGFHLKHLAGVLDRLATYARGELLSEDQRRALRAEGEPGDPPAEAAVLVKEARAAIERTLVQVRATRRETLLEPRGVGRQQLPSTVLGLLCHAAEHAARHAGQALTTARVIRGAA